MKCLDFNSTDTFKPYIILFSWYIGTISSVCMCSTSTECQPTLQELQALPHGRESINVIEGIAPQWKRVATALSFNSDRIDIISTNSSHNVEDACWEMLRWWLDTQRDKATWRALIKAIRVVELHVLAHDIETALE